MSSERAYQFFRLVERMRNKQKEYFRTKSQSVLNEASSWNVRWIVKYREQITF